MGELRSMNDGGEIDWAAVFDGLATNRVADARGQQVRGDVATGSGNNWEHFFPPPIPTSQPFEQADAGPSRPRILHRATYDGQPEYQGPPHHTQGSHQAELLARLAQGMYVDQHDPSGGFGPVPHGGEGITSAHAELEERLRRRRIQASDQIPWSQHCSPVSASTSALPLIPLPNPPSARPSPPSRPVHARHHSLVSTPWPSIPQSGNNGTISPSLGGSGGEPNGSSTPIQPHSGTPGAILDTEDKRQRNTLASAKFRAKRKKHMENISQRITELEGEQTTLTRDVADLKQENKFLREMVELKYGLDVGDQPQAQQQGDGWQRDHSHSSSTGTSPRTHRNAQRRQTDAGDEAYR